MRHIRLLSLVAFAALVLIFIGSFFFNVEIAWGRLSLATGNTGFSLWLMPASQPFYGFLPAGRLPWMYYFTPPTINWLGSWRLHSSWACVTALSLIAACLTHMRLRCKAKAGGFPVEVHEP